MRGAPAAFWLALLALGDLPAYARSAAQPPPGAFAAESLAPGLTVSEYRFGEPAKSAPFAVTAGIERVQKLADALLARVEGAGFRALPVYGKEGYEIRIPGFADRSAAEAAREQLAAAGIGSPVVRETAHDLASPTGPFVARVLEVDPGLVEVEVAHARDAAIGLETTRDLARRRGALAAVNGGFFTLSGPLAGESEGILVVDGRVLSEPDRGRAGVGFVRTEDGARAVFGRPVLCAEAFIPEWPPVAGKSAQTPVRVDGVNRERRRGELILYTPEFHRTTLTGPDGVEKVSERNGAGPVRRGQGSAEIPPGGVVYSFAAGVPEAALLHPLAPVAYAWDLDWRLGPREPNPEDDELTTYGALGAGPLLLFGGQRVLEPSRESISRVFSEARHPRTAVAARADGSLLFVTVDGRQPDWSVGMTLVELTDLLLALGAADAVNLDGGGSTAMVIRGETVNRPSDPTGDRANGDAILLFAR